MDALNWVTLSISVLSLLVAAVSLYRTISRDKASFIKEVLDKFFEKIFLKHI